MMVCYLHERNLIFIVLIVSRDEMITQTYRLPQGSCRPMSVLRQSRVQVWKV